MNVVARPVAGLAVCAGAGGIELGLQLVFGPGGYRTVGYVERDAYAAAVLVARMAEAALDPAPVWDDVATFDGRPWRGRVDLVSAGFPCQPFSQAGARRGVDDERWVWPDIARVVGEVGPRFLLLENVPGLAVSGLGPVLGDLADLGFDAEWDLFTAAAIGTPHLRRRLFVLAWRPALGHVAGAQAGSTALQRRCAAAVANASGEGLEPLTGGRDGRQEADAGRSEDGDHQPRGAGEDVADRNGRGRPIVGWESRWQEVPRHDADRSGGAPLVAGRDAGGRVLLGNAPGAGRQGSLPGAPRRGQRPAWPGDDLPLFPPGPDDVDGWATVNRAGGPEPAVRRVADGLAARVDRLHTIGNGVVPLVAAVAFVRLAQRAGFAGAGEVTA